MYHLCNGIRHLIWDAGWALEMDAANRTGWISILVSLALTAALWVVACL